MKWAGLLAALALLGGLCGCGPAAAPAATPTPVVLNTMILPTPEAMDCLVVAAGATPTAGQPLFALPDENDRALGPANAAITFIEYGDLQSPAAPLLDPLLAQLQQKYPADVRVIYRHFPIPQNDKSLPAAAAVEAAGQQGRFWQAAAALVARQSEWTALDETGFSAWLDRLAVDLGLDAAAFNAARADPALLAQLEAARQFGLAAGIPGVPFLLINNQVYQGPRDLRSLEAMVGLLRLQARQFETCPKWVLASGKEYSAVIQTSRGEVVVRLFADRTPLAVNNFVFLARQGWFDGNLFHRVLPGDLVQSGDPSGSGLGGPGYVFADDPQLLRFNKPGLLAMANSGPNSNGSQFFITLRAAPELDGTAVVFGEVVEGLDVLAALTPRDPSSSENLPDGDTIQAVTILER